jgi:hypothetical protein
MVVLGRSCRERHLAVTLLDAFPDTWVI